jgi:hypothetical protein
MGAPGIAADLQVSVRLLAQVQPFEVGIVGS